ncbi:MAG TPA: peptidase S10, partial [Acidobacteriaceae bacterium]
MPRPALIFSCLLATLILASSSAGAKTPSPTPNKTDDPAKTSPEAQKTPPGPPQDSTTEGTVNVGGQRIAYQAVVGTITVGSTDAQDALLGLDGKPVPGMEGDIKEVKDATEAPATARMSYVAYFKTGEKAEHRPVTFIYNGGPGSSTVWLHMGSFGPRRVVVSDAQHTPAAPYKLIENNYSLLDTSDLVFVDMPGTGFGRLFGANKEKAFWGVDQDAHAFARFIQRFLGKYGRWNSPKYLFGESYGTTRSANLANILENEKDIDLNGVILLSQILNFSTDIDGARGNPGVDIPYITGLPTYAATAWYHHKLPQQPPALEPFLTEVENFALGDYAHALGLGNALPATEKQAIAEKLNSYTGLPVAYLLKADLRISGGIFEQQLQGESSITTGRLDTRFSGPAIDPLSAEAVYDPQSSSISSAYVSTFNDYVRRELKYGEGQTFLQSAYAAEGFQWDTKHGHGEGNALNVMSDLADAMKTNPRLKVMLNSGYYDLATPFFAAVYEEHHLPIPASLAGNIEYQYYESG